MSTYLTILTKPTEQAHVFRCMYACGKNRQGTVIVTLTSAVACPDVAAELSALQYILETLEVCGKDRAGNSMCITVSLGAIKKLAQGKSEKEELAPFALFLRTRFADAEIKVSRDESFILTNKSASNTRRNSVDTPLLSALTLADGQIAGLTHHALHAYMVRYQVSVAANAWRALRAAAQSPQMRLEKTTGEEQSRHGKEVLAYANPNGLRLIVARDLHGAKILTCYYSVALDLNRTWASSY